MVNTISWMVRHLWNPVRTRTAAVALLIALWAAGGAPARVAAAPEEDKVAFLALKLKDASSFKIRLKAAVMLGRLADARAVEPLVRALRDESYVVRGAAARALGNLGLPMAAGSVESIFKLVDDEEPFVQQEARQALMRLVGDESLDQFVSVLQGDRPNARMTAVQVLATREAPAARDALLLALGDEDEEVRAEAVLAIQRLERSQLLALLRLGLARKDAYRVQAAAAQMIGELKMTEAMSDLSGLLVADDAVPEVKKEAARALTGMKQLLDVPALVAQLQSADRRVQSQAIQLLGLHGGRESVDALLNLLKHEDPFVRQRAVFALGDAGDSRAIPALEYLLKNETDARFRQLIERTLRKLRP